MDVGGRAASGTSGREKSRAFGELIRVDGLIQSFPYIIADRGDQWSFEHLFATLLAAIPLLITVMVEYVISDE